MPPAGPHSATTPTTSRVPATLGHPTLRPYIPNSAKPDCKCPTSEVWGHCLESIDPTDTFRILLQNPNGLKLNTSMEEFILGTRISYSLGAAVVSLTETNTNWNQLYQLKHVNTVLRNIWSTTSLQTSQHPESLHSQNQRGGTLQLLTDCWVSRLQTKGVDPYSLGRWSYMIITWKRNKK
jgi:hypothetical protein